MAEDLVWPYTCYLTGPPKPEGELLDHDLKSRNRLWFVSQDYLGLTGHPAIREAILDALDRFGPHSARSPMLA